MKRASLNHAYRLVWSDHQNAWVAVSENSSARGKRGGARRLRAVLLKAAILAGGLGGLSGMALAGPALPTGGKVTSGKGTISQGGSTLTVKQSSGKLGIDWKAFSIGQGNTVQFIQPGRDSVALNRVTG